MSKLAVAVGAGEVDGGFQRDLNSDFKIPWKYDLLEVSFPVLS
jgi:hypothetical protein